jgi:endoglucanase
MTSTSSWPRRRGIGPRRFPALFALALLGCGSDWSNADGYRPAPDGGDDAPIDPGTAFPKGLHAVGNRIQDDAGNVITLRGVNRSGTEYACTQGGLSEGPLDEASVQAIADFHANAVRVPLNETCWLDINGIPSTRAGAAYQRAIKDYVALLHRYSLVPILELHWTAPGEAIAASQPLVPDMDHAPAFWADVATAFADDTGVVFEPFNEPVHNYALSEPDAAWACWRDGCTLPDRLLNDGSVEPGFEVAGVQDLIEAIRDAETAAGGQSHLVIQAGLNWSNDLSGWLEHMPNDPAQNFGAAWHIYGPTKNVCNSAACWDAAPAAVAELVPLVATEIGQDDCQGGWLTELMSWLDARGAGYLAWSWNAFGPCEPGSADRAWSLIQGYYSAEPNDNDYARTFRDHLATFAD